MAWLGSPVDRKSSDGLTHGLKLQRDGQQIVMPPVAARYIVDWLYELDWAMQTGMGLAPLSCAEIRAWQQGTDTEIDPWEFALLRSASRAYVRQVSSDDAAPPYSEQPYLKPAVAGVFKTLAERFRRDKHGNRHSHD